MKLPQKYKQLSPRDRRLCRLEYIKVQGNLCNYCGESLTGPPRKDIQDKKINLRLFPENFLKWPIHLHHCHKTGWTIGAVHAKCNGVLWQYHGE